ncbi:hypothetical protein IW261DRAFT_1634689 [Armillaria novae-zelandiae]|uniref:Uncharacterized protein n=1 Tax=Armillaria novae-zelandiae TaxID=153914 RepID=A0AA39U4M6_9AGAR|nr:hypothetical protein IW261DRAFT_1634689 [Armillaria novae-zelandiae]
MLAIRKHLKDVRDRKKCAKTQLSDLASSSAVGDDMVIETLGNSEGMSASSLSAAQVESESDNDVLGTELDQIGDIPATEPTVRPPGTVTIEEVEDIDSESACQWHYQCDFPDNKAGVPLHHGKTTFQHIRNEQILKQEEVFGPFQDDEEWELVKWLIKNMGHSAAEEFLKLPMISLHAQPQYKTKQQLYDCIDDLPQGEGTNWKCYEFEYKGDILDDKDPSNTKMKKENLEMWFHNPLEIIHELIGNPVFKDVMAYAPIQLFTDPEGPNQVFNEMWMGEWWWKIQERLPPGVTIAPLILSSDKTLLSQFCGNKTAWPIYLTIGNIAKDTRRQLSSHATILLGYLLIPKFDCYTKKLRSIMKYRLFHHCMTIMIKSIADAGHMGVKMVCADALVCLVYPIFAVYITNYPEQCLESCCMENRCPICKVHPDCRGSHDSESFDKRDVAETLSYLKDHAAGKDVNTTYGSNVNDTFKAYGLQPVYPPFWASLPHSDIFMVFTPDLLHQLHKGVFKDHLIKWCTVIIGAVEVDKAFQSMPSHPELHHFKNGILHVSQWTGTEHKEMEKVFLALVAVHACNKVILAVCGVIDFIYLALLQSQMSMTLSLLRNALDHFHDHKNIFIQLEAWTQDHFNIPKIHSMEHYEDLICLFGSADRYNTEAPEWLHIDYAKDAYRATNRKDYMQQMTWWLQHQEAVDRFTKYLAWARQMVCSSLIPSTAVIKIVEHDPAPPDESLAVIDSSSQLPVPIPASTSGTQQYHVSNVPPPDLRNVEAAVIISPQGYHATEFIPALQTFLHKHGVDKLFTPHSFDQFSLWRQVNFLLPDIPKVGQRHHKNIIHALPSILDQRHKVTSRQVSDQDACLDGALICTGEVNPFTNGTSLQGMHVGHVYAIFTLPKHYPSPMHASLKYLLVYIEWFTPFRSPDSITGFYHVSKLTRQGGHP